MICVHLYIYIYIHIYYSNLFYMYFYFTTCVYQVFIYFFYLFLLRAFNAQHVCIFIYIFTCNSHISPAPPIYVQLSDILNPSDLCTILQYPQPLRFTYNSPISHFLNLTCMLLLEHVLYLVSIIKFIKIYYHCINCI